MWLLIPVFPAAWTLANAGVTVPSRNECARNPLQGQLVTILLSHPLYDLWVTVDELLVRCLDASSNSVLFFSFPVLMRCLCPEL
jgi:hypothetical protein